jgi:hypothetical protein
VAVPLDGHFVFAADLSAVPSPRKKSETASMSGAIRFADWKCLTDFLAKAANCADRTLLARLSFALNARIGGLIWKIVGKLYNYRAATNLEGAIRCYLQT